MRKIIGIWIGIMSLLTGLGVYGTLSRKVMDDDSELRYSMREDSVRRRRGGGFFGGYFSGRGPTGGGLGYGK